MKLPRCQQSGKVGFLSQDQAEARALFITAFMKREQYLRAYQCGCGRWHLTKQLDRYKTDAHPARTALSQGGLGEVSGAGRRQA